MAEIVEQVQEREACHVSVGQKNPVISDRVEW